MDRRSIVSAVAAAVVAMAMQGAVAPAMAAPRNVEQLEEQRTAVLATDQTWLDAWRRGDATELRAMASSDARFVDGLARRADQLLNKTQFLAHVSASPPGAVEATDRNVRLFGLRNEVAIVNGELKGGQRPDARYSAVYSRVGRSWKLALYHVAPVLLPFDYRLPASTPPESWSPNRLPAREQRIVETLRVHFDALARRDDDAMERTVGDDFWYVRGGVPGGDQHGKAEFMRVRRAAKGGPEIVTLDRPNIRFYGSRREVAVVSGMHRSATGGVLLGKPYSTPWRSVTYYTVVLVRPDVRADDWVLQHYHAAFQQPE